MDPIPIALWLLSSVAKAATSAVVSKLLTPDLQARLHKTCEGWRSELPEGELLNIEAIFPRKIADLTSLPPEPGQLLRKLQEWRLPTADEWLEALIAQWKWVGKTVGEPQPFFLRNEDDARASLHDLAERLEIECLKDKERFQVESLRAARETTAQIDRLSQQAERTAASTAAAISEIAADVNALTSRSDTIERVGIGARFHHVIDAASAFTRDGRPDVAIARLEELRNQNWHELDGRERFRVLANLGHAHSAKEELAKAATYFIDAVQHQPTDEKARCLEAVGYAIRGDHDRAFAFAAKARADFPNSDFAWATCIRSAPVETAFEDLEASVPDHLRSEPETAFALSWRAFQAGRFKAAEDYARNVLTNDDESAVICEHLGMVLVEGARLQIRGQHTSRPRVGDPNALREALDLFERALGRCPAGVASAHARLAFYSGIAHWLLGNIADSGRQLARAHNLQPAQGDFARQYALHLCDQGALTSAVDVLRESLRHQDDLRTLVLLADTLQQRNEFGDGDEAESLLQKAVSQLNELSEPFSSKVTESLVALLGRTGRHAEAAEVLNKQSRGGICTAAWHAIDASRLRRSGYTEAATAAAREALNHVTPGTHPVNRRRVAIEAMRSGLFDDALAIWKSLVEPTSDNIDIQRLLFCAAKCDDDAFILRFCATLRENGVYHRDAIHAEIDTLTEFGGFDTAIAVMQGYLGAHPDSAFAKEIHVRLSHLGIVIGRDDVVGFDPRSFPGVDQIDALLGLLVVEVLSHGPHPLDGVQYAYELLRANFDSHFAHRAMVVSVLFGRGARLTLPECDRVGPGAAVKYRDDESGALRWYIIEDSPNASSARDEYPPSHQLARELHGKACGEQFWLRNDDIVQRKGTILEIWSKYKYRFNACMEEWENRFPEEIFLWKFSASKKESGEPDLSQMLRTVDDRIAEVKRLDELYRRNPISSSSFALAMGSTVLEMVQHLAADESLPIRCSSGTDDEYSAATEAVETRRPMIVDATALSTLLLTGFFRELHSLPFEFVVSSGTVVEFRRRYFAKLNSPSEGGFLTKNAHQYVLIRERPEDIQARVGELLVFLDVIRSRMRCEEGLALAALAPDRRRRLVSLFGRPEAETIALAEQRGYVLWTDDLCGALVANDSQKVRRVWTEFVAKWAADNGKISSVSFNRLAVALLGFGYFYTRVSGELAVWCAAEADWEATHPSFAAVLKWLSNPFTKPQGIASVAAVLLREAGRRTSALRADAVTLEILAKVNQRPDGKHIIDGLRRAADSICGLDVVAARRLKETIVAWLNLYG
ncbi:MAG: hypothetical protein HYS13_25040 [Planctomycetia bacterium]|nr:hypothetical protein [Planctomycetia bacterium]